MAKTTGPLTPEQARASLAHRVGGRIADRLRPLATRFGIRPFRVFLVWQRWGGQERGEGDVVTIGTLEIFPTPLVESLDAVALDPRAAGILPVGSIRVSQVSVLQFTRDTLMGFTIPGVGHVDHIPEPVDFFYEIVEDGRGDDPPVREKYRLSTNPFRRAGKVDWTFMLERISEDRDRQARSVLTTGQR